MPVKSVKAIICAVNGAACGAGLDLVTTSDIAIAADHATFFDPHVSIGVVSARINPSLGIVNWLIGLLGIPPQGWFGDPHLALATVVFVDVWHETSLMLLMLYAGLALVMAGNHAGWVLALPAAPAGGGIGLLLARKLARQL